ncbi:ssDNA endodeoxyribonuclease [Ceratobasidium sp. 392]|nr:ssDNA endodeoxyribonuclease [Ceratobasidium sp. 392]
MSQQTPPAPEVLQASVNDVRHLASMLRGVAFVNRATMSISEAGITVTVEEARSLIANAYVPYTIFSSFLFNPPSATAGASQDSDAQPAAIFEIQLDVLLECLNIFGTASGNLISKAGGGGGEPKGRPKGQAKGKGRDTVDLNSSWLREALSEIDASCDTLTLICTPGGNRREPALRIHAVGSFGSTEMDYPNDREVLELFECVERVSFNYRFSHIARALRALQGSLKTSLRIDGDGLLSLQFMMPASQGALIEFRCLALVDEA